MGYHLTITHINPKNSKDFCRCSMGFRDWREVLSFLISACTRDNADEISSITIERR